MKSQIVAFVLCNVSLFSTNVAEINGTVRSATPQYSTAATESQVTDLVNPAQKLIGTWQGSRHRKQYFADGTMVIDPHLVPDPPRTQWPVEGDRLIETYPEAGTSITVRILSITDREPPATRVAMPVRINL